MQAAGSAQEEQEYVRLVMYEILYGKFPLTEWAEACRAIPGALIMDCRGIFDALNSESSGLGMKDKRSAVEALALRRAMNSTGTALRWCHSGAQLSDVMTKDAVRARQAWDLFVQRGRWKLIYDGAFISEKKRKQCGVYDILAEAPSIDAQDPDNAWKLLPDHTLPGEYEEVSAEDIPPAARSDELLSHMRSR